MATPVPRTVRLRRLGKLVEHLRRRAGLTQAQAAELVGVNRSTWIAMEGGKSTPHRTTLLAVAGKLDASDEEGQELVALAAKPDQPAWMRPLRGRIREAYGEYIDLESGALSIESWEPLLVPGLLQTQRYARAHTHGALPDPTEDEIDARVTARLRRQAAFAERDAPLSAVIGEAALRYQVGGPEVQREQLTRLLEASQAPNLTVQVIPFSLGAHPSMSGSFAVLSFEEPDPPVVYVETPGGDVFFEEATDLAAFRRMFCQLKHTARSPTQSQELMAKAIEDLERQE